MSLNDDTPRRLYYPYSFPVQINGDVPANESIAQTFDWPTQDPDEKIAVTMTLSLNEYVALASCVDVGRDLAYPNYSLHIWWVWNRAINTMEFCEQVDDCIENNPTTQLTINNVLLDTGIVNPNSIDAENTTGIQRNPTADVDSVYEAPVGCDLDVLWAGIHKMVEIVDQNGRDILEDLQFLNDKIEQYAEIIDLVPLLGDTIKDIGDLFTQQIPDMLNAYNSASSPTFLSNVACDLFDMVCSECRYPTFEEVVNYFGSHSYIQFPAFSVLTYSDMWTIVKAVTTTVPEPLWYTINLWQCFTLSIGGTFNRNYGTKSFAIWASFGEDNPNDNWKTLCDECVDDTWGFEWSGALLANDWTLPVIGVFNVDHIEAENTGSQSKAAWPVIVDSLPVTITQIQIDVDGDATRASSGDGVEFRTDGTIKQTDPIPTGSFMETFTWNTSPLVVNSDIELRFTIAQNGTDDPNCFGNITRIRILGEGTPPAWNGTPV